MSEQPVENNSLNILETQKSAPAYAIIPIDSSDIKRFVESHAGDSNEKHWVMYDIRWANDYPLFTFGAATCITPIFVNRVTNEIGLGHLPYLYTDHTKINLPLTKEEQKLEEAKTRLAETGSEWDMYLLGGQPIDDSDDHKELAAINARKVIEMFESIGVTCYEHTNKDPSVGIDGIIVDPESKQIQVCYSPNVQEVIKSD